MQLCQTNNETKLCAKEEIIHSKEEEEEDEHKFGETTRERKVLIKKRKEI